MTEQRPPRIRTDASHPFANHTMRVRVPVIVDEAIANNPEYSSDVRDRLAALGAALRTDSALPALDAAAPHAEGWRAELAARAGQSWLDTDWFFAENYAYRQIAECVGFWQHGRDPFLPVKRADYASAAHREAFERALSLSGAPDERLHELLKLVLFGNRMDLSFAAAHQRGTHSAEEDLLCDDREAAILRLTRGHGPLHLVIDNAGTELTLDLVLADFAIEVLKLRVVLHLKVHPAFVSDAMAVDVVRFLEEGGEHYPAGSAPRACLERLEKAREQGELELAPHPYFNGPLSLWQLPLELERRFQGACLVVLKGDAHYRRALGDAIWPPATPFAQATRYFPAPLLALRTLKSDPIVGLAEGQAERLDVEDPSWRVNARRAVASLGGRI
ncbi:MAG TPA: damage-control phosphatase ARMT1 family protein [Polyangiaceae bacterium]|nr:damage-control phosphatase ARMT1 family protein [Polyangiaceae bacterium]